MEVGLKTRLVLLQFWCGVLSVAVVVMAAFQLTARIRAAEEEVSTEKLGSADSPKAFLQNGSHKSNRSSLSYIQLISWSTNGKEWTEDSELSHDDRCQECSLFLQNNTIHCKKAGLYQLYAQVNFNRGTKQTNKVTLKKNAAEGRAPRILLEASIPKFQETVFVSKLVSLQEKDSVSIIINGTYSKQHTFWGMIQFQ